MPGRVNFASGWKTLGSFVLDGYEMGGLVRKVFTELWHCVF